MMISIMFGRMLRSLMLVLALSATTTVAESPISAVAFSPSGDVVVSASLAGVEVREWPQLSQRKNYQIAVGHIQVIKFSPDGKRLLIAGGRPGQNGAWQVVRPADFTVLAASDGYDDVIYAATWLNKDRLAIASDNNAIAVYQFSGDKPEIQMQLRGHSRRILAMDYVEEQKLLVSAGVDQSIRVWSTSKNATGESQPRRPLRILDNHTAAVRDLAVRPGKHTVPAVASASVDRTVRIWQPTIGRLVRFTRLGVEPVCIAWSRDGEQIAIGCTDGKLRILNPNTVEIEQEVDTAIQGWIYAVAAAPDESFVIGGTGRKAIRIDGD